MEIKIDIKDEVKKDVLFPTGCVLCKGRSKLSGKIYLIIPGHSETHIMNGDGCVTFSTTTEYLNDSYEFVEKVKLFWD